MATKNWMITLNLPQAKFLLEMTQNVAAKGPDARVLAELYDMAQNAVKALMPPEVKAKAGA